MNQPTLVVSDPETSDKISERRCWVCTSYCTADAESKRAARVAAWAAEKVEKLRADDERKKIMYANLEIQKTQKQQKKTVALEQVRNVALCNALHLHST